MPEGTIGFRSPELYDVRGPRPAPVILEHRVDDQTGAEGQKDHHEQRRHPVGAKPLGEKAQRESDHPQRTESEGGNIAVPVEKRPGIQCPQDPAGARAVKQGLDGQIGTGQIDGPRGRHGGQQRDQKVDQDAFSHNRSTKKTASQEATWEMGK